MEMANPHARFSSQKEKILEFTVTFNCLVIKEDVMISIFLIR